MAELDALESWAGHLLAKLNATARRAALRDIVGELRKNQQTQIAQQKNPDGLACEARKPRPKKHLRDKAGRIKRKAMFAKLRQAHYLRAESDAVGVAVGFAGRVARVHQFGETDRIAKGAPEYKYPACVPLGFTSEDREIIRHTLLAHIAKWKKSTFHGCFRSALYRDIAAVGET